MSSPTTKLILCPRCRATLDIESNATQEVLCSNCQERYPWVAGIPVLLANPQTVLDRWVRALGAFTREIDTSIQHVTRQLVEEQLAPLTHARLTTVVESLPQHKQRIVELFADAGITADTPDGGAREHGDHPDADDLILSYFTLIHRDWGWAPEVDEVTPALDGIVELLPSDFQLGNVLILGAGTGRLAWELGRRLPGAEALIALDINPLPFLVTERLMSGKSLELFELPGHPRRAASASVERELKAFNAPPPGLRLIFADALDPPIAAGSIDTVVTPWFVDQVPADLATLPATIGRVLREGGTWINQGPLVYDPHRTTPAHRYCADEVLELVSRAGFKVHAAKYERYPYLASPVSSQSRTETVLTMYAQKVKSALARPDATPPWLRADGWDSVSVPMLEGLGSYRAEHPTIAAVARLINGQRTATDIARELVEHGELADDGGATVAVSACLKVLWQALK